MRLVDTSAFIEWLIGSQAGEVIVQLIPAREEWLVPSIIQFELAKWLSREISEDKADQIIAFTQMCHVVPLDTKIALAAVDIARTYKLAAVDAIVYATALEYGADLLTCDAHFDGLEHVVYVAKNSQM
jgi:predicted nucleic acid-binding protein